jgi:hypothetical protein
VRPADLAANLGSLAVPDGIWSIKVEASWYGSTVSDSTDLLVLVPDLSIGSSDISFGQPFTSGGDTVLVPVSAEIHNIGSGTAGVGEVRFMLSAPDSAGIQMGTDEFATHIDPDSGVTVTLTWNATEYPGEQMIWVVIDPDGFVVELDKANNIASATVSASSVEDPVARDSGPCALSQNSPNPFTTGTVIRYTLPEGGLVELQVYDIRGRLVKTLARGRTAGGYHNATWDGTDLSGRRVAPGLYFLYLRVGDFADTKKMILLR